MTRWNAMAYRGNQVKTADLIDVLAQDAPVRWRLPGRLGMAFAVGALIAVAVFASGVHLRPDLAAASHTVRVQFKFLFAATLLSGAAGAVTRVGRPDAPPGPWTFVLAAAPILLGLAVIAELLGTPAPSWMTRLVGQNAVYCLTLIPALALGPLACLLIALRDGAPTQPGRAGAAAGLAASGIAVVLYASHCPDDSPLFVAVWYSSAITMVVAAGYFAGGRLLKW
jgi:hypothetical protein